MQEHAEVLVQLGFVLEAVVVGDAADEVGHRAVQCVRKRGRIRAGLLIGFLAAASDSSR